MEGEASTALDWQVQVVQRVEGTATRRWLKTGTVYGDLHFAIGMSRHLRTETGAARLTAPGFEVVALRDYLAVRRDVGGG